MEEPRLFHVFISKHQNNKENKHKKTIILRFFLKIYVII